MGVGLGGPMVLSKLPVPGVLLIWIRVEQRRTAAPGVVWTFFIRLSFLSSFSLSLGDGPI